MQSAVIKIFIFFHVLNFLVLVLLSSKPYLCYLVMNKLYLFNPNHDLALAVNDKYYVSPQRIRSMEADLSALPAWYAPAGSAVAVAHQWQAQWMQQLPFFSDEQIQFVTPHLFPRDVAIFPWGWNKTLVHRLSMLGCSDGSFPTPAELEAFRNQSGRAFAVGLLSALHSQMLHPLLAGWAQVVETEQQLHRLLGSGEGWVIKAPWSSSGKGIRFVNSQPDVPLLGWASRILRTQGYLVVERFCNKVSDFALEFKTDGNGQIQFIGYSIFDADAKGAYHSNLLATDAVMRAKLGMQIPLDLLDQVRDVIAHYLSQHLHPAYRGYLGVDMMVCLAPDGHTHQLHPCVEVNLRTNMGVVAHCFAERWLHPASQGCFSIHYYNIEGEALRRHQLMLQHHPLFWVDGRIRSGYQALTPINGQTTCVAEVLVERSFYPEPKVLLARCKRDFDPIEKDV